MAREQGGNEGNDLSRIKIRSFEEARPHPFPLPQERGEADNTFRKRIRHESSFRRVTIIVKK